MAIRRECNEHGQGNDHDCEFLHLFLYCYWLLLSASKQILVCHDSNKLSLELTLIQSFYTLENVPNRGK